MAGGEPMSLQARGGQKEGEFNSLLQYARAVCTLSTPSERELEVHLGTFRVRFLFLVGIIRVDPFGMNDIVRHNMVFQDFSESLFAERGEEIDDKIPRELLPCLIVGNERSDDGSTDEVTFLVLVIGPLVVPVKFILEADFL